MYYINNRVSPMEARSIAAVLSSKLRVNIEPGDGWLYNFPTQTVNYREEDLYRLTELEVVANILHEVGHAKYSTSPGELDYSLIDKEHKNQFKELVNLVEDFRIEDLIRAHYPFAVEYLPDHSFKTLFILEQVAMNKSANMPKIMLYFLALYSRISGVSIESRMMGKPEYIREIKELVDKTIDMANRARFETKTTEELTQILAGDIYPIIKHIFQPDQEKFTASMIRKMIVMADTGEENCDKEAFQDPSGILTGVLGQTTKTLRRLLSSRSYSKFSGKHTSGKLNNRRLYRFGATDYCLFEKRQSAEIKQDAVALLVDVSGSMRIPASPGGKTKIYYAVAAAMLFTKAMEKIGISHCIYSFNDIYRKHKALGEKNIGNKLEEYISMWNSAYGDGMSWNNDGYAIMQTSQKLMTAESRKVLFVISDGEPAPSDQYQQYNIKGEIANAEKKGVVVIGIGIGEGARSVQKYYPNHVVVDDITSLPQALVANVSKALR